MEQGNDSGRRTDFTTSAPVRFSIIIPVTRCSGSGRSEQDGSENPATARQLDGPGEQKQLSEPESGRSEGFEKTLSSLFLQENAPTYEIILVASGALSLPADRRLQLLIEADPNPAVRRNHAAAAASGEILAFIDDDAVAAPDWLASAERWFRENPDLLALGGPDPSPPDAPVGEQISETLLATRWIGSGIAAHEHRGRSFTLRSPHDVALVNLFVRREEFERAGGFDPEIGYIGEDTALLALLIRQGRVVYAPDVVVFHRRRPFPGQFIRQRWRYRLKTGRMLLERGSSYRRSLKLAIFLAAAAGFLATAIVAPPAAAILLALYIVLTYSLAALKTELPIWLWPLIPLFFLIHHSVYLAGILTGAATGMLSRQKG
jgi:succinoglycan biosynthesis protein ExoA